MYTQCPDCKTAFRITAEVLKQASGRVRCGGCSNAFNALEFLSEDKPADERPQEREPSLPELKPDRDEGKSISAEQSAALLKTLDELAGSDIRIEDTGVEWRVVDDDDEGDGEFVDVFDAGASVVDEVLEDSPTPVDQFLTETPSEVDSPEIFEASANVQTPVEELRFDDNTPLPEDFDFDDKPAPPGPVVDEPAPPVVEPEPQADLSLSEPDEWEDILDEFDDLGDTPAPPLEAELAALDKETPEEAGTPASADEQELLDMDTQFALQAEAMGIDLSGMHKEVADDAVDQPDEPAAETESEESPAEPESEAESEESPAEAVAEADDEPAAVAQDETPEPAVETSTRWQLIDDSDAAETASASETFGSVSGELRSLGEQSDVFDSEFFRAADQVAAELEEEAPDLEAQGDDASDAAAEDAIELVDEIELESDLGEQPDLKEELELAAEPYPEEELGIVIEAPEEATPDEPVIPEMSEEEQTINAMIDQELLSVAVEDDDGFASTIVIPDEGKEKKKRKEGKKSKKKKKDRKKRKKDMPFEIDEAEAAGFETIIMEGEHVRSAGDYEKREADVAAAAELVAAAKAEEAAQAAAEGGKRLHMIGAVVALVLLLALQALHQSREALATIPVFNKVVGPVYRVFGQPLSPAWDITGWRIEARTDSVDENDGSNETLVVYSRIGNNSDSPLPYPIISISLTDRFQETLGSRQLDPAEYLPDGLDPSELVQPGNTFNAVISIESLSADASGYRLDLCYRGSSDQLRCAIPDFK